MSRALALVKFNKTGNIYMGVYSGTTDVLYPVILTPEKCINEEGIYDVFRYVEEAYNHLNTDEMEYDNSEIDDVEIYSDYGGGFYWEGKGVEKHGYILNDYLAPFDYVTSPLPWYNVADDSIMVMDGVPKWAEEFMNKIFKG